MTELKERCQRTIDIVDAKTDEERRQEKVKRAVDAAFERLRPLRRQAGLND